jgi:hypothetical protein
VSTLVVSPLITGAMIAAVVVVVVAIYLLRPPALRVLVPSSLVWERVLRGSRRRDDRLRWWLSLLLAALIAGLLAFSVLHSQSTGSGSESGRIVIVVDNSPTMAARMSDGGTRFEQARQRAREVISSLRAGEQVLVADTMRRIPLPSFDTAQSALASLDRLAVAVSGTPAIAGAVLRVPAEAFWLFTDGVLLRDLPSKAQIESVFESVENVGISRFELRAVPDDASRYQAFIEVENAGGAVKEVDLSLLDAGGRTIVRRLSVPAFAAVAQTLDVSEFGSGPLRAALTAPGDGFEVDDVAYAYLPTRRTVRVTLVTDSNPYLEASLSAQPRVRLRTVGPGEFAERGEADAYVFDRFAPAVAPAVPALLIRPGPAPWLPPLGGETLAPRVGRWNAAHPLLDRLSLRDLRIDEAASALLENADPGVLVRGAAGEPLLIARDGTPRWIWLAFSLDQSNFALQAGFPVFLSNAVDWMSSESVIADARLGEVRLPLQSARVIGMDGSEVTVQSVGRTSRFEADTPGIYTAASGRSRLPVVVNALDSRLTQVNRSVLPATIAQPQTGHPPTTDLWGASLAAAVLLLVFEWMGFNRRLTV